MATFTMTLKDMLEKEDGKIGLDDYPIFDESYRASLNKKIIDHFYNQEIGQETPSMFRLALSRFMNEIMPAYNQHYVLGLIAVDPLSTVSMDSLTTTTGNSTTAGTGSTTATSDSKARAVSSDFPQQALQADSDYASSAQDTIGNSGSTGTSEDSHTASQDATVDNKMSGYQGQATALIFAARQAIVNVDLMILQEIERANLFMVVWSATDDFTNRGNGYYGFY